jgi:hypothetical protein
MARRNWFKPRPPSYGFSADTKAGYEVIKALFRQERPPCPSCNAGALERVPGRNDQRRCGNCSTTITLSELHAGVADGLSYIPSERAAKLRKDADVVFLSAAGLVVISVAWAIWKDSWVTLVGAVVMAIPISAQSVVLRYRAWQVETNRMFRTKAPFGQYIRERLLGRFFGFETQDDHTIEIIPPDKNRDDHDSNRTF